MRLHNREAADALEPGQVVLLWRVPEGETVRYRTIVADPPWEVGRVLGWGDTSEPAPLPYSTMDVEDIAALPVRDLAERDSHLYVWTINAYVDDTYDIARDWGFKPIRLLTWVKNPIGHGLGGTFASCSEFILFARRGSLKADAKVERSWFDWPRQHRHSQKPEAFLDMVETVSPPPRLEMFSRRARLGWDVWGNEVDSHVELTE